MEKIATNFELLFEKVKEYSKTSLELFKLNAIDKAADISASLTLAVVLGIFVAMFSLFISISISLYIGQLLGEYYLGFLIVSCFYLFVGILLFVFRDKLIKIPITNFIIKKLLETKIR